MGLIHLYLAPQYASHQAYLGVLFVLNAVGAAIAAYGIWHDERWGWIVGITLALLALISYVLSRTTGLPGFHENGWFEPLGIISVVVEAGLTVLGLMVLRRGAALTPSHV